MNLSVHLAPHHKCGLDLLNPIMIASGFGGYGVELARIGDLGRLGALITNPLSLRPWPGTRQPRLREVPAGFLLQVGWQNPGLRHVLRHDAASWAHWGVPIIVHICGGDAAEHARLAARVEVVPGVAGLALSPTPGIARDEVESALLEATSQVRAAATMPLLVELPFMANVLLARRCVELGADALVVSAPPLGWLPDMASGVVYQGQLFSPALLPLCLRQLGLATELDVPLIARGGVHTLDDILACLAAGARAVLLDSVILRQPAAPWELLAALEVWLQARGLDSLAAADWARRGEQPRSLL